MSIIKSTLRGHKILKYRPTAECVLYLPGEGDAYGGTIRDISGNTNHGTISGATWTRLPSGLWGLYFDGNDYVTIADSLSLRNFTSFSIETWLKTASVVGQCIYSTDSLLSNKYIYLYQLATGKLRIGYRDDDALEKLLDSNTAWNDNKYHHILVVRTSGASVEIFVDGVSDGSSAVGVGTGAFLQADDLKKIGTLWDLLSDYFTGYLALFRIHLTAVTPSNYAKERWIFGV